jgi:hypothetical protein
MRAALFSPMKEDDVKLPYLAETAIFSQWFHSDSTLHYARWKDGEVDIVMLAQADMRALWAVEVKWSDRYCVHPEELDSLISFCIENHLSNPTVTSKTLTTTCKVKGDIELEFTPASVYCYTVGYNLVRFKKFASTQGLAEIKAAVQVSDAPEAKQ